MRWFSNVYHHNNDDNDGESIQYSMGSNGKPKACCAGFFGKLSEAHIALGAAADANIVINYILADGDKCPKVGALPPAKNSRGRILNLSRCAIAYHILGLSGAVNQIIIISCLDIGLKNG